MSHSSHSELPPQDATPEQEDRTHDNLASSLHAAIDLLDQYGAQPNSVTFEAQRIPFGRFAEGTLATSLTVDEYSFFAGSLSFMSSESNHGSFHFRREVADNRWWSNDRKFYADDRTVLKFLDASWPQYLADNASIRRALDSERPTWQDILTVVHEQLESLAPYHKTEKIYHYARIHVDESGKNHQSTQCRLGVETDHDGFQTKVAQIEIPYQYNGVDTPLYCRAEVDEIDTLTLTSYLYEPITNKRVYIPIWNTSALIYEFETTIGQLVGEKLDR